MKNAAGVTGIPHALVMSSDWVVRWQGHPAGLQSGIVEQIIRANGGTDNADLRRKRWTGGG